MLALLYLALCYGAGRILAGRFFSAAIDEALAASPTARLTRESVLAPIGFVSGVIFLGWITYLTALVSHSASNPLLYGNVAAFAVGLALTGFAWAKRRRLLRSGSPTSGWQSPRRFHLEWGLGLLCLLVAAVMMWRTLRIDGEKLVVGISVFSDFGPHLAVIRSFSLGQNFPTEYPHFPDGSARYHFMFQFLAGNLEYLGLPLDWAFNLPSALAFVSCCLLLYALAVLVTGSRLAGVLTVLFFFFRSSLVWMDLVAKATDGQWFKAIVNNDEFIGRTRHEDWGLWNQNIFVNQRHLAFALGVLWFALIQCFPLFARMQQKLWDRSGTSIGLRVRGFFLGPEAWFPRHYGLPAAALGLLLGASGFWNGAVLIAALMLLFGFAIFSERRLEYLIVALVAGALAFAQNRLFLGPGTLAVAPAVNLGFLADEPKSISGILRYYYNLLGILPFVLLCAVLLLRRSRPVGAGLLLLIFLLPLVFATTIQLTPDVAINHKYVMIAVMLLNILAAAWIASLFHLRRLWSGLAACVGVALLTATGVVDAIALFNRNRTERAVIVELDDPLLRWAQENAARREVFLTDWYSIHPLLLSGRSIFYGWPYYAWSAGYDTQAREDVVKQIYGSGDRDLVIRLMKQHGMRYLLIDNGNREQKLYQLKEEQLRRDFPVVFAHADRVVLRVEDAPPPTQ